MYDLELSAGEEADASRMRLSQAVCVREPLPKTFFLAGCGHMNTWGQQTSEYLRKVAETAQLAGARALLVANEVNAAYVAGALKDLRIPYVVTRGNHTMPGWDSVYAAPCAVSDDGPMRIVTFSEFPREPWENVKFLSNERLDARCRVLVCYEAYLPPDLASAANLDLVFDGHGEVDHPARRLGKGGAWSLRSPSQHAIRWIPMSKHGVVHPGASDAEAPVLFIPREEQAPLRAAFESPNDGTATGQTVTVSNEFPVDFPACRIRADSRRNSSGAISDDATGAGKAACSVLQSFDSDDGRFTILDVEAAVKAGTQRRIAVAKRSADDRSTPRAR